MAETKLSLKERLRLYDEEKKIRQSPETLEKAKSMGYTEEKTKKMLKKANNAVAAAFRAKGYYYPNEKLAYFKVLQSGGETFKYYYRGEKNIIMLKISLKEYLNDENDYIVKNLFVNPTSYDLVESSEMEKNKNENLIGFDRELLYMRLEREEPKPEPVKVLKTEDDYILPGFAPVKFEESDTKKKSYEPMSVRRQMKQRSIGSNDPYDLLLESIERQTSLM